MTNVKPKKFPNHHIFLMEIDDEANVADIPVYSLWMPMAV
jgi:hypothetical protein